MLGFFVTLRRTFVVYRLYSVSHATQALDTILPPLILTIIGYIGKLKGLRVSSAKGPGVSFYEK